MLLYLRRDGVPKDMLLATQYYRFRSTPIINFQRQACEDLGRVAGGGALLTPVEIRELSSDGSVNRKTRRHSKPLHYTRLQPHGSNLPHPMCKDKVNGVAMNEQS